MYLGGGEGTDPDSLVISNSSVGSGWYSAVVCLSNASAFSALMCWFCDKKGIHPVNVLAQPSTKVYSWRPRVTPENGPIEQKKWCL